MTNRHRSIPEMHPGELLREDVLPALNINKTDFAGLLGISRQHLHAILNEERPISPKVAVRLGKLCGNGARLWMNLQTAYDLDQAERTVDVSGIKTLAVA